MSRGYPRQRSLVAELHVPAAAHVWGGEIPTWDLSGWKPFGTWKHIFLLPPVFGLGRKVGHQPHVHTRGATGSKDHLGHLTSQSILSWASLSASCPESGLNQPSPSSKSCSFLRSLLHLKGGLTSWLSMTGCEDRTMLERQRELPVHRDI